MLHSLVLAGTEYPQAAGLIFRGIKGIFVLIGGLIAAFLCAIIASMKGRSAIGWGICGFFFSILTLIVVLIVPSKK